MHTCCRAHPTSQLRCPSCSPSTSKLCCAFSPLPWLLTSKPWPGRGFSKLSQGKLLGCRSTKLTCAQPAVAALGGTSSTPTGTAAKSSHSQDGFAILSVHPCPPSVPSRCCSVPVSTGQLCVHRAGSSSSEEGTQCFGLGFQSVRAITYWNRLFRAGRFC